MIPIMKKIRVWGLAAGRGTTAEAARGAFCCREYNSIQDIPNADWLDILRIEEL